MLSDIEQRNVWEGWLSSEIRANYFADLCGSYQTRQQALTWLTLLFSSGAFLAVVSTVPDEWRWIQPVFPLIAAALSFFTLVSQNQKSAIECADLHLAWNRLAADYERLWDRNYESDAPTKAHALEDRMAELSKRSTAFPYRRRRMLRWQQYVHQQHGLPVT
jgi:hypothetical protein